MKTGVRAQTWRRTPPRLIQIPPPVILQSTTLISGHVSSTAVGPCTAASHFSYQHTFQNGRHEDEFKRSSPRSTLAIGMFSSRECHSGEINQTVQGKAKCGHKMWTRTNLVSNALRLRNLCSSGDLGDDFLDLRTFGRQVVYHPA